MKIAGLWSCVIILTPWWAYSSPISKLHLARNHFGWPESFIVVGVWGSLVGVWVAWSAVGVGLELRGRTRVGHAAAVFRPAA